MSLIDASEELNLIHTNRTFEVTIVGGGEAGCHAAIALAKVKNAIGIPLYKINILEKKKLLLWGTSRITPGRLGEGYHYSHLETALKYLQETLSFMRHYPSCVVGKNLNKDHPLRRGRYVVMKQSQPGPAEVWKVYQQIQKTYEELVRENPDNKIWGETNNFLKVLYIAKDQPKLLDDPIAPSHDQNKAAENALKKVINLQDVAFVVETAEELLDWKQYRELTLNELSQYSNIKVFTEMEVTGLELVGEQNFVIRCRNKEDQKINFSTDFPVICAWENSENLIKELDVTSQTLETTTNRLKAIITIKLPQEMQNTNSYFFCMGPYVMFSNLGEGFGKITYAPITNMQKIDASQVIPNEMALFLNDQVTETQKLSIANKILLGAKAYIPLLEAVQVQDVVHIGFGIVKTRGNPHEVDISDPLGKIGERDYGWVRKHEIADGKGFIVQNDAMKIVYSLKNGEATKQIINEAVMQLVESY